MKRLILPLAAALAVAVLAAGCDLMGDSQSSVSSSRISRQDLKDSSGATTQYWTYQYDALGSLSTVKYYNSAGVLQSTTTYSYDTSGRRTRTESRTTLDVVANSTTYTYDGISTTPSKAEFMDATGTRYQYNTFTFEGSKKKETKRFDNAGTSTGRTVFDYDLFGTRTGFKSYDAAGTLTSSGFRTYVAGQLIKVTITGTSSTGTTTTTRSFTWETGLFKGSNEPFFEF